MAISGDYPSPVNVNGFSCKNCTEVDEAKKHIDPAHPKDGPYGVNAADHKNPLHPGAVDKTRDADKASPAVTFGGLLAGLSVAASAATATPRLDLRV
jgi:hypothetical protein